MLLYTSIIVIVATFGLFSDGKIANPFPTCKRDSADISNCLVQAIQEAWPLICKGIPELDFPAMDPMILKSASAKLNIADIHVDISLTNMSVIGVSKMRFYNVTPYFLEDSARLQIYTTTPSVYVESNVKVNGALNVFRIFGEGYFNETLTDVKTPWDLSGPVINDTWIIKHFRIIPSLGNFKIYFNNLIETQGKEFNDFAVNFVNQFWPALYRSALPIIADIYEPWMIAFPNKIFSKIAFSEIFP